MTRKILSLTLAVMMIAALVMTAALADDLEDPRAGYYYVVTGNGLGLNVRDNPNGNVVGSLKYGTKIYVYGFSSPEWAVITYRYNNGWGTGEYAAFVSARYLSRTNPGKYEPKEQKTTPAAAEKKTTSLETLNAIFRTARQVEAPYTVISRPSRASGWVNLRWAPSTDAERIATCPQGKQLTVLAELKGWYQVKDPVTGMIGFISSQYVTVQ